MRYFHVLYKITLKVSYFLLRRLLGVRTEGGKKAAKVTKLTKGEVLMVNIGSLSTGGRVIAVKNDAAKIALTDPICTEVNEKIALSRRIGEHLLVVDFFSRKALATYWLGYNPSWNWARSLY